MWVAGSLSRWRVLYAVRAIKQFEVGLYMLLIFLGYLNQNILNKINNFFLTLQVLSYETE